MEEIIPWTPTNRAQRRKFSKLNKPITNLAKKPRRCKGSEKSFALAK